LEAIAFPIRFLAESIGDLASTLDTSIANSISNMATNVVTSINNSIASITTKTDSIVTKITDITGALSTIKDDVINAISNSVSGLTSNISGLKNAVIDEIISIKDLVYLQLLDILDGVTSFDVNMYKLLRFINPGDTNFIVKLLLSVSDEDKQIISESFDDMMQMLKTKLSIIDSIDTFNDSLNDIDSSRQVLDFKITLPDKYGGAEVKFFDLSPILPYAERVRFIIKIFIWAAFILRTYRRLPRMVY